MPAKAAAIFTTARNASTASSGLDSTAIMVVRPALQRAGSEIFGQIGQLGQLRPGLL
jgi:hypothetical protein